jgi:hypothetical protein
MAADITDERIAKVAARLHDGGWLYTARQLYYGVCAEVETVPVHVAPGEVGLGVLLILVGAITGQRLILEILGALGLLLGRSRARWNGGRFRWCARWPCRTPISSAPSWAPATNPAV